MNHSIRVFSIATVAGLVSLASLNFAPSSHASHYLEVQNAHWLAKAEQKNLNYDGVLYCDDAKAKINIRRGPGTDYQVGYSSFRGLEVDVIASYKSNGYKWYKIRYVNQILHQAENGWVREDLIKIL
ncbi:hypothetical protein [Acaryochloris marina]|uniref:hypothetical protein n=1 Tax=Acaryochloris marina TaxID=155978 RepID=UPI001BB021D8|nr:hypothetical protein [Acaryochloris marina]QUY40980.1 hypothetical protein I1H34_16925 [Acaryochloris marina S15]